MKNLKQQTSSLNWLLAIVAMFLLTGAAAIVDPTRPSDNLMPAGKSLVIEGKPKLSAIFIYPNRRMAIINGNLVKIGDKIDSYTIINIQDDTVELNGLLNDSLVLPLLPTIRQTRTVNEG
jgi:hypothetical protein